MQNRFIRIATIAALVLGAQQLAAQQPREISYGLASKSIVAAVPRVADELGLFQKHGLKVNFVYVSTTSGTATALLSKSIDVATTGVTEVLAAQAKGQQLVILANQYDGAPGSIVLSKATVDKLKISPNAPAAERLKALDGLLIASTSPVSNMTITYKSASAAAGANPRFSYMAIDAMTAAMESGAVQGMVVTAPFWAFAAEKGSGVLWLSPSKGDLAPIYMPSSGALTVSTKEFAEGNPDVAKRVMAVFQDMSKLAVDKPAEVRAAFAKLYPEIPSTTLNLILDVELKAFQSRVLTPNDIAQDIKFMKESGVDIGPIDTVDPKATVFQR